jgi:hypothetical protein
MIGAGSIAKKQVFAPAFILRNDAINKIKSTAGTVGTYACGGQGYKTRLSSDVDCSLKQEGIIVRCSIEAHPL